MSVERKTEYIPLPEQEDLVFSTDTLERHTQIPDAILDYIIELIKPHLIEFALQGWLPDDNRLHSLKPDVERVTSWVPFTKHRFKCKGVTVQLVRVRTSNAPPPNPVPPKSRPPEKVATPVNRGEPVKEQGRSGQASSSNYVLVDTLYGHTGAVRSVTFDPRGQYLFSAGRELKFWDINARPGRLVSDLETLGATEITKVALTPNGKLLACAFEYDGSIKLWDVSLRRKVQELYLYDDEKPLPDCTLAFSSDGKFLAGRGGDVLKVWDVSSGRAKALWRKVEEYADLFYSIAFSPDSTILATGFKNEIELWYLPPKNYIRKLKIDSADSSRFSSQIFSLTFSADGLLIVSGNDGGDIHVWSVPAQRMVRTLPGDTTIRSVAIRPDGTLLASGGVGIKLWKLPTGEPIGVLDGQPGGIHCVAFSPDGQMLASSSQDSTINLWKRS